MQVCRVDNLAGLESPRTRESVRVAREIDARLRREGAPVVVPPSYYLPPDQARTKRYGDSWTCQTSSELLRQHLARTSTPMHLASVGPDHWPWGDLGRVDYHYFLVDDPANPSVLVDPTFHANFSRPGGSGRATGEWLLRRDFTRAGAELGCPSEAAKLLTGILSQPHDSALMVVGVEAVQIFARALTLRALRSPIA